MSFAQHLPEGPGPPVLLLTPEPLPLWLVPLGGLLLGTSLCWAPTLLDLSSLGSKTPAPFCDSEQVWTSSPLSWAFHPKGCCSEPSGQGTELSGAPGLGLSTLVPSPGPGLLAPPRERSRGDKSVSSGEQGTELAVEAADSPCVPPGDGRVGLVGGILSSLPDSVSLCFCSCSSSALDVFLGLWLPS